MLPANRTLILLVLLALLFSVCQPITRPAAQEPPTPHGLRFDAPEYAVDGPYAVGVRYITIPAKTEQDRELTAVVWYPAQKPEAATTKMAYELQFAPGEIPAISVFGNAVLDAPSDASGAPYPLVVYTHAHWSFGQELPYLAEHLASRGFVVISADHEDNWSTAFGPMAYQAMIRRPQEVTREIDFAESLATPEASLSGMIDTTKVGVTGWSMGGETSLAVAGARWDLNKARSWCVENPGGAELNTWVCADMLDHEAEMAAFAGLDETPQGLWPSRLDPRIGAAVSLAGPTITFGSDGMKSVDVPVMFIVGAGETAVDPAFEMAAPYESISAERKAKVVLDHGEHLLFFSGCADTPSTAALGFSTFCTDPVWDMDRAHDLVNHFATAFFLAELKGDAAAAAALAPENVRFSGIQYDAKGYGAPPAAAKSMLDENLDGATVTKIETILNNTMQSVSVPGYAMCIVRDGGVVYSKGFGTAELGKNLSVTSQSVFAIRSTTKSFTATALMQLVEQSKVDLDAPVTTYLPYFTLADPRYKDITVRMLASHTSGMVDDATFASMPPKSEEPAETGAAIEWFVRSLADDTLSAAPSTQWQYAGTNFILLADIIGQVSGEPYDVYVTKHLLEPLGMVHTTLDPAAIPPGALVGEHVTTAEGVVEATPLSDFSSFEAPEGGIYSTCEDMTRWMQVHANRGELNGVRILQPESYDVLWHAEAPTGLDEFFGPWIKQYGLGWSVGEDKGHLLVGHPGGSPGQNIGYQLAPDDQLGVTVLADWGTETVAFPAWTAAADVLYALLGIDSQ